MKIDIICNESNNTPQTQANNQLVCDVYIHPTSIVFEGTIYPDGTIDKPEP